MSLVWIDPPENEVGWWGDFNDKVSGYENVELLDPIEPVSGVAAVDIPGASAEVVGKWDIVRNVAGSRLISARLRIHLTRLVGDQMLMLPVVCRCRDGDVAGYHFVVPRRKVVCTDLNQTEVSSWVIPDKAIHRYRTIRFKKNCIVPTEIVRDALVSKFTVVGDDLANELRQGGYRGLNIVKPEDAPNPYP